MENVGIDIELQVSTVAVTKTTSSSLSLSQDTPDASTKDSIWESILSGKRSGTISVEGLYDDADAASIYQFVDDLVSGNTVALRFARTDTPAVGEPSYYSANALVSGIEISGNDNEATTISATLELTGAVTATKQGA